MNTKESVLDLLKKSGASYISGEQIAAKLHITRAAVWKAVNSLKKDGWEIDAVTKKGYRLTDNLSMPNESVIRDYLNNSRADISDNLKIFVFDSLESTNNAAKQYAFDNPGAESVFIADNQTKGRGRRGRSFYSPAKTGIYMSFLLHPAVEIDKAVKYTCMMASAACLAIEATASISPTIKWVNDLYHNGKKISGILTEGQTSIEDNHLLYVVIGIGINLYPPIENFPEDIEKIAGTVFNKQPKEDIRNLLCANIIKFFFKFYRDPDINSFTRDYRKRSMLIGKKVKITPYGNENKNRKEQYASVLAIDDECRLVVRFEDGHTEALSGGEVSAAET